MRIARTARTFAPLLGLAGLVACGSPAADPLFPADASVSFDGPARVDVAVADRATSSTLSDGHVVTGQRPIFQYYSRDMYYVDLTLLEAVHSVALIRSDGAVVLKGCSGVATPAELAAFEAVVTDLATVDSLRQTTPCGVAGSGDDVSVIYVGLGELKHSASCDPQLRMLTEAGSALIQAVCARATDGGIDAATDAGGDALDGASISGLHFTTSSLFPDNPPPTNVDVTLTDATPSRAIHAATLALPAFPSGILRCPSDPGYRHTIAFTTTQGVEVTATLNSGGCRDVTISGSPPVRMSDAAYWTLLARNLGVEESTLFSMASP